MPAPRVPYFAALFAVSVLASASLAADADRAFLLSGVSEVAATGAPGNVCLVGSNAFPVITGRAGKALYETMVGAATWEKGRVVAFGHNGYLSAVNDPGTTRLIANAVKWTAGAEKQLKRVVVHVRKNAALQSYLAANGFTVSAADAADWTKALGKAQVLCVDAQAISAGEIPEVTRWVKAGGGLVTGATGWGWASLNPAKRLSSDFPGNQLLLPAGLVFGSGTPDKTTEKGYSSALGGEAELLNASSALAALVAFEEKKRVLSGDQLAQASATIATALRTVPSTDLQLLPRVAALRSSSAVPPVPTEKQPLRATDALARLIVARDLQQFAALKPDQIRAHPASAEFPGGIAADAPRLQKQVIEVDTAVCDWHSTGLYAPPGAVINVSIPATAVDKGLSVRIGAHSDSLWHLDAWKRVPEVTKEERVTGTTTSLASAFGGLIYVVVPRNCTLGKLTVSISGAVQAPLFTLGKTSVSDWKAKIRVAPGPWAELATSKVILTVPSLVVRTLDDPEALMKFWDQALDAIADLATVSRNRERPERIVADVDISAGYMHSGYPIMTHLDVAARAMSVDQLRKDGWGFWHELGHNHQAPEWTFGGTTEVTCNLFSLYVCETICGLPPGSGHDAMDPVKMTDRLKKHLATRASFERWKADPFLALTMYDQLRAGFGWEAYKKVFAEYRSLAKGERPKSDGERRDQWLIRFSRATGKNLGPFFEQWGVPTSGTARESLKDLTGWMPADWPQP